MTTYNEILLQPGVPQQVTTTLSNATYQFTFQYRADPAGQGGWVLDIADASAAPIVQGIPLVTGENLLAQYAYLGFVGGLWVQTKDDPDAVPTFEDFGDTGKVYWVTVP